MIIMRPLLFSLLLISILVLSENGVSAKRNLRSELQVFRQFLKYVRNQQTLFDKIEFKKMIEIMSFPQYIFRNAYSSYGLERQGITCVACRSTVKTVVEMRKEGHSLEDLIELGINFCVLLQIQPEHVCEGVVKLNLPIMIYIIDNEPRFSPETFCGVLLQTHDKDTCPFNDDRFDWSVDLPAPINKEFEIPMKSEEAMRIVQISDIHYDPLYEPNGLGDCNDPVCCRKGQTKRASPRWRGLYNDKALKNRIYIDAINGSMYLDLDYAEQVREMRMSGMDEEHDKNSTAVGAGYWGDYRSCDIPWWAVEDGFDTIIENHKQIDYVYYTGDTVDHGVWATTKELITESIKKTTNKFKSTFGDKIVISTVGNHESQPLNQFGPISVTDPDLNTSWLYDLLAEQWSQWLPADALKTIKIGGYYTVLLQPGLRVIVLNSNLCYRYNWWLHLDPIDPSGQLKWMINVLTQSEANNERVHILSHIPSGITDCLSTYTREYKRIVERFSKTITAEFNGHTHNDEFKVFYAKENISNPVGVAWNGGSLTAFSYLNPNYRVFDVDTNTFDILDIETWVYNLTEANLTPNVRPKWYLEYRFKEHFKLDSLSLSEIDNLLTRMVTKERDLLVKDYHLFRGKTSDPFVNTPCDEDCVKDNLLYFVVTELYDTRKFDSLWESFQTSKRKV